jgi:hypothetical protein
MGELRIPQGRGIGFERSALNGIYVYSAMYEGELERILSGCEGRLTGMGVGFRDVPKWNCTVPVGRSPIARKTG